MSPTRFFGVAAILCGLAFAVAFVVVNVSCNGDFQCGSAGDEAWVAMLVSGGLGFGCLLVFAFLALGRER